MMKKQELDRQKYTVFEWSNDLQVAWNSNRRDIDHKEMNWNIEKWRINPVQWYKYL